MSSAFQLIWFGYVFLFDFRVGGFDVLPDAVGYLLIAIGLHRLSRVNQHFAAAARLAPVAMVLSLADFYQPAKPGTGLLVLTGPSFHSLPGALLTVGTMAMLVVNMLMTWHLLMGTAQLAKRHKEDDVEERAGTLWPEYKTLHILLLIVWPVVALFPSAGWVAPLCQLSVAVIAYLSMITWLREASDALGDVAIKDK